MDCGGVSGDMVYLTDLDTADCCGLNIAEVEIYQFLEPRECSVLLVLYLRERLLLNTKFQEKHKIYIICNNLIIIIYVFSLQSQ